MSNTCRWTPSPTRGEGVQRELLFLKTAFSEVNDQAVYFLLDFCFVYHYQFNRNPPLDLSFY